MKKKPLSHMDDEIDLIAVSKIIWSGKIKIILITIFSYLIALGYSTQIPLNYVTSLTITKSHNSEFNKLVYLANSIKSNRGYQTNQTNTLNEEILNRFINELKDYEEFLFIIKNKKKVSENLSIEDQKKKLFKYVYSLQIAEPKIDETGINMTNLKLNLTWKDPDEAKNILRDTLNLTLKNLEKLIYEELEQSLKLEKGITLNRDIDRINYLKEQSSIARELDIKDNKINNPSGVGPYYVRGYQAIDKEIDLIKKREYKNFKFLEQEINSLKKKKIQWVNYNIYLINTKSLKNTKSILIKSVLLGFILSILYVFISNIFKSHTHVRKN